MTEQEKLEQEIREFIKKKGGDLNALNLIQKISIEEVEATQQQATDDYIQEVRDLAEKRGLNFSSILR